MTTHPFGRVSFPQRTVQDLVTKTYTAATDPSVWDDFLSTLARVAGASCAAMTYHSKGADAHMLTAQYGIPPEFERTYRAHYGKLDEWYRAALRTTRAGWVGDGPALISERDLARSEFYNDHLRLNNDLFHFCAGILQMDASAIGSLSFLRTRHARPFGRDHTRLMQILLPHAQRAVQIHNHFEKLRRQCSMLETALDRVTTAVIFVELSGRVIFANRSANTLLNERDGLISGRDGLRAASPQESSKLQRLIRGAALTGSGKGFSSGGVMQITRGGLSTPLTLLIAPIAPTLGTLVPFQPVAAIFVTDPNHEVKPSSELLGRLYGLTPAECAIASLLAQGSTLQDAADTRGVTIGTARSQLKTIFRKLNVSSQSQLVRFILLLPANS